MSRKRGKGKALIPKSFISAPGTRNSCAIEETDTGIGYVF